MASRLLYPFSYYGGKIKLFPWIKKHLPKAHSFVDVFGGSGVVALNLVGQYRRVVYNDLDKNIVNFFRVLRDHPDELIRKLTLTPCSRVEHRGAWEKSDDCIEQARRTFVKISQSYSRIGMREQRSGWLLPDKGCDRTGTILSRVDKLESVVESLRHVEIECMTGVELIAKENKTDTLLFADPPYVHSSRNAASAYYHEMKDADHVDMCKALNDAKSMAVVCGYENPLYEEHLQGWDLVRKQTYAATSATRRTGRNSKRVECLWIKN